jgi:AraC family transcriptional regulator, regulatory protein of adaptative response / methylated-DNA-[protein]-cysteine methyltransferase
MNETTVRIEEALPGDAKSGGAGMRVEWGRAVSPFGPCSVGWSGRRICHLAFCNQVSGPPDELIRAWPNAVFFRNDKAAKTWVRNIFVKKIAERIPAFVRGTAFQLKVWRELLRIPPGCVATYSSIAAAIGNPGAARAVGTACGANPVAWLIPCHRVIRATGAAGGYRWGNGRKQSMIEAEAGDTRKQKSGAGISAAPL